VLGSQRRLLPVIARNSSDEAISGVRAEGACRASLATAEREFVEAVELLGSVEFVEIATPRQVGTRKDATRRGDARMTWGEGPAVTLGKELIAFRQYIACASSCSQIPFSDFVSDFLSQSLGGIDYLYA